jgi:hypothetical protein
MVTISTPSPNPATNRQLLRPKAVVWKAITRLAALYQSSDQVNIARRPNRSARKPQAMVPINNPANNAATKLATPVEPNRPGVVGVRIPALTRPGAT